MSDAGMGRRSFMGLAAGSVAGAAALSTGALWAAAFAEAATPAGAFDLQYGSQTQFPPGRRLKKETGWQSMAFDDVNKRLYYVQAHPDDKYDLVLSWIKTNGDPVGSHYMRLNGFGHGQMMGVEQYGGQAYVWLETFGAVFYKPNDDTPPTLGRRICCLKYTDGVTGTYRPADVGTSALPGSRVFELKPGSRANTPAIDMSRKRLLLRYNVGGSASSNGTWYYAVYNLADVRAHGSAAKPVYNNISEATALRGRGPFQGATLYGDYGYILTGPGWAKCEPENNDGRIYLTRFLLANPAVREEVLILTSRGMKYREPEGVAVQVASGRPRLTFGLVGVDSCGSREGNGVPHEMGLYYKDKLGP